MLSNGNVHTFVLLIERFVYFNREWPVCASPDPVCTYFVPTYFWRRL